MPSGNWALARVGGAFLCADLHAICCAARQSFATESLYLGYIARNTLSIWTMYILLTYSDYRPYSLLFLTHLACACTAGIVLDNVRWCVRDTKYSIFPAH